MRIFYLQLEFIRNYLKEFLFFKKRVPEEILNSVQGFCGLMAKHVRCAVLVKGLGILQWDLRRLTSAGTRQVGLT